MSLISHNYAHVLETRERVKAWRCVYSQLARHHIREPTRVTPVSNTLIDLRITNSSEKVQNRVSSTLV